MENLRNTRTILNEDTCNDKAGQVEFTREFSTKIEFEEWLKVEQNTINWNLRSKTGLKDKPKSRYGRPAIYEWTATYYCPFSGQRCDYTPAEGVKRRKTRASMKVGCKAMLKASKKINDESVIVNVTYHTNHTRESNYSWTKQRLSPLVREWLERVVESGSDWNVCKALLRPDDKTLDVLESGNLLEHNSPVHVQEVRRIKQQDFYNIRYAKLKSRAQLSPVCRDSLIEYVKLITSEDGISTMEEWEVGSRQEFLFSFCTAWQLNILSKYTSLLCLDSTHNTCYVLDDKSRKAFLHTIVIRHSIAGCGVPVAFMITSSETRVPLERWLKWLKVNARLTESPTFMIDCSVTEVAGIRAAFDYPKIRYCHWHFFRALSCNAKKISDPVYRKTAVDDFIKLVRTRTVLEFTEVWETYQQRYQDQKDWLGYLVSQWMGQSERWWLGNRTEMEEINTNNLVESWHNKLKTVYLKSARKQRPDFLVYKLLREALIDLRLKVAGAVNGLGSRRMCQAETSQLNKCNAIRLQDVEDYITRPSLPEGSEELEKEILVKSFTNTDVYYTVSLNDGSSISRCTCPYMANNRMVCKHMFMVERLLGYTICYDFSGNGDSQVNSSQSSGSLASSSAGGFGDHSAADNLEVAQQITAMAVNFSTIAPKEKELFDMVRDHLSAFNRSEKRSEVSLSQRQRR